MSDWDNPNNGNDDWYADMEEELAPMPDDVEQQDTEGNGTIPQEEEIKPVRLKKRGAMWVMIAGAVVVFIFAVMSVGWFDGEKSNNSDDFSSVEIQQQQTVNNGSNIVDNGTNFSGNQPVSGGVGISPSGESKVENNAVNNYTVSNQVTESGEVEQSQQPVENAPAKVEENNAEVEEQGNSGLVSVSEPVLGELREVSAAVLSKNVYKVNRSYGYMIELVVVNNDKEIVLNYFCPRKTYDALRIGDTVRVQYQSSEDGTISIASVSR